MELLSRMYGTQYLKENDNNKDCCFWKEIWNSRVSLFDMTINVINLSLIS